VKIGLNGQKLLISKLAGPEVYTYQTFQALAKTDKDNKYIVYFDRAPDNSFWSDLTLNNPKFSYKIVSGSLSWTHIALARQLFKDKVDVFFSATHTIPLVHPKKTKFVSMIHGLEYKINKQFYKEPIRLLVHPFILWWVLFCSKIIVVPSKATKQAITSKNWPFFNQEKIRTVPEGVSPDFYHRSQDEIIKIRQKHNIGDGPYFKFVSTIQPRKNIPSMIQGFSQAIKQDARLEDYKLLISGKLGWLYQESLKAPGKYGVDDKVIFLGRTSDEDLPILLSGAEYFVSFSLDEGFGIPLLQAMACETPALVSDIPAFKELGQDTPIFADPKSIESIKNGFLEAVSKPKTNEETKNRVKKAKDISKSYTWEKGAEKLITFFESLVKHI